MIIAENVAKSFGHSKALKGVNFHIQKGEYVALLGVNGAGKTTLVRILSALAKASSGNVQIAGYHLDKNVNKVRARIGVMSHHTFLYGDLSAEENLRFYGKMYHVSALEEKIDRLLARVNLAIRKYDPVRDFSRGMQQRLSLARAILHEPDILFLDEPFAGLDVNAEKLLTGLIHDNVEKGTTILLTTHDIEYALQYAGRILLLKNGVIVCDQPSRELTKEIIVNLLAA